MAIKQLDAEAPRGTITLAFGAPRYLEMAKSLARSLKLHAPLIPRAVVTDSDDVELRRLFTHVIPYRPEFGSNVRQKLHIDLYSPFAETLFIDSDCLVLGNLESFWKAFAGQYFGALGSRVLRRGDTDRYLDVNRILDRYSIQGLPKFNGGVYYFRRSDQTARFFELAREILSGSDDLHFRQFRRDGPADESIFSVAMALKGLEMTSMGTGGMWTPIESRGGLTLNVMKGFCSFTKEGRKVTPEIIHFAGEYAACFAYPRECARLKIHFDGGRLPWRELAKSYVRSVGWRFSRNSRTLAKTILVSARGYSRTRVPG
jgi:hypothetical protein